ncbi:MAG: mannosyl-glycoprotein endo-beta-N-acetylglucosamidase [Bacteroidia bacterium]|nr:mannosyl-glycoprotein endo-beta-N-acetylglucosamidase [Bacteroidia bacterium]
MTMTRSEFIHKIEDAVVLSTEGTGLFPSVVMAQAILETGDGNSTLADKYHNYFGIKADPMWKGETVYLFTTEYINEIPQRIREPFRVYDNALDSIRDRNLFLKQNPRYKDVFKAETAEDQTEELAKAGYATDPEYAAKIKSIINGSSLKYLDLKKK